jgi:hypothetical protein
MAIKKMGNERACILSPTIISGEVSNWRDTKIIATENKASNIGTIYNFFACFYL